MTPCPYLPEYDGKTAKRHGLERGAGFYLDDLRIDEAILIEWPWPYAALKWILEKSADGNQGFLGNPVRHFQHLATRMSGPRKEVRIARAWKCFHISRRVLEGKGDFPLDGRQIAREGIFIPRENG